jgi:hypothetical protein
MALRGIRCVPKEAILKEKAAEKRRREKKRAAQKPN